MNNTFSLEDILPVMKEQLDNGKTVSFVPKGNSMLPMLRNGKDMVLLKKTNERLHLSDVAFYYRRETDSYVIHRVAGFQKDGSYIMLGDNNITKEYNIRPEDIIAVMTAFYRKGKMYTVNDFRYRAYCEILYFLRPLRNSYRRLKIRVKRG